jgi:eukaryotic-like serine/threonine-protein kinase
MPLNLQQLQALDALVQTGLDQPEAQRRAWFEALTFDEPALEALLEHALFPDRSIETASFLDRSPEIDDHEKTQSADVRTGQTVGSYTLIAPLGEGGSASIWRAQRSDGALKREVALKLPYFVGNTRGWHERVTRERDILASLNHPNIASIYDAGVELNGRPWLALELIDGVHIDAYCKQYALSVDQRIALITRVARAVEYAHARGVIHRDLKPGNILVDGGGQVKLLDFGIAKLFDTNDSARATDSTMLTRLHGRPFTPEYASPEQKRGETITTGVDVYALGTVLYELIVGARPEQSDDGASRISLRVALKQKKTGVACGSIRSDLNAIIQKALHPDLGKRYLTVNAFADDLQRYLKNEAVLAQPDTQLYRVRQFVRRNKFAVGAGCAVATSLLLGIGVATWQAVEAKAQRDLAKQEVDKAQAVTDFLVRLFETSSSDQVDTARKRAEPIESVLRNATRLLPGQFEAQPDVKITLLQLSAKLLRSLRLNRESLQARRSLVEALSAQQPRPHEAILRHQVEAAIEEYDIGNKDKATSELRALDIAMDGRTTAAALEARVLANSTLAHIAASSLDRDEALKRGARAVELAAIPGISPSTQIEALSNHAYALDVNEQIEASRQSYERAIEVAEQSVGTNSMSAALSHMKFGESLIAQSAPARAKVHLQKAVTLSREIDGSGSFWSARAEHSLARTLSQLGEFESASRLFKSSLATYERLSAHVPEETLVRGKLLYSGHLLNMGDIELAAKVFESVEEKLKNYSTRRVLLPLHKARLQLDQGKYRAAERLLISSATDLESLWKKGTAEQAQISLRIAFAAAMDGRLSEARAILDDISTSFPDMSQPFTAVQHTSASIRALIAFLERDAELALQISTPVVKAALAQAREQRVPGATHAVLLRHSIFLASRGDCASAIPLLEETTHIAQQLASSSYLRAQSIAIHRQCLTALGRAQEISALPEADTERLLHPDVPRHFKIGLATKARNIK